MGMDYTKDHVLPEAGLSPPCSQPEQNNENITVPLSGSYLAESHTFRIGPDQVNDFSLEYHTG